ncbi:hypothetical protein [Flavihumibacter profundi]|uniref:hypothetical protein n=1 Tax=Flavihumibacter profundi TaxID=2716883 RepID=UPI001CC34387|nr:hypothetical protein [Flavihumibacter profundi]MBZ5855907.1 hypothetical protein [Flavihumibacter profundi]
MKFTVSILLTALLSFALCIFLEWWSIAIAAFIVAAAIHQVPWKAFLSGFLSLFLLWVILSWIISSANNDILAQKVSIIILKKESPGLLILVTGIIGGLVGGFGALTGCFARKL